MQTEKQTEFGRYISQVLKDANIRKQDLAKALEIDNSTFSRAMSGDIRKPLALAMVTTINRLAKRPVASEDIIFQMLGYEAVPDDWKLFDLGSGFVLKVSDNVPEQKAVSAVNDLKIMLEVSSRR